MRTEGVGGHDANHLVGFGVGDGSPARRDTCIADEHVDAAKVGHDVGDELLRAVAKKLRAAVRDADTVARLGGDEFVVVVDRLESDDDVASIAHKIVSTVGAPSALGGKPLRVTTSLGVAVFPDDADSAPELVRHADEAMYAAKAAGRSCYRRSSAPPAP